MRNDELAREVRSRRLELGYRNQAEAARAAGVSDSIWQRLESKGDRPGTPRGRLGVARALGWAPEVLEPGYRGKTAKLGQPVISQPVVDGPANQAAAETREAVREALEVALASERSWWSEQVQSLRQELADLTDEVRKQHG